MLRTLDAFMPVIGQWLHATSELDHSTVVGGKGAVDFGVLGHAWPLAWVCDY
jgi:hypothetical protein